MRKRATAAGAGALVLALAILPTASPCPARAAATVLLRAHFTVGQSFGEVEDSTTTTVIDAVIKAGASRQKLVQHQAEVDHFPLTITARAVHADGSTLVRVGYGPSSVTTDGKIVKSSMKGVYRDLLVRTDFSIVSEKSVGLATLPVAIHSAIPDPHPTKYPKAALPVGGTWQATQSDPQFKTITLHYTLLAIGSHNGRPAASVHATVSAPTVLNSSGLLFTGTLKAIDDSQFDVATGSDLAPSHSTLAFKGKLSGSTGGAVVTGTFNISGTMTTTPQA